MSILQIWLNHRIPRWKLYWIEYLHLYQSSKLTKICCFLVSQVSPKHKQNSIRKFRAFFQFRAIWNILALYNKFSLHHYMAEPANGGAQVLRLWDFGGFWSTLEPMLLSPECFLYVQNSSNICLSGLFFPNCFSQMLWKMFFYVFLFCISFVV